MFCVGAFPAGVAGVEEALADEVEGGLKGREGSELAESSQREIPARSAESRSPRPVVRASVSEAFETKARYAQRQLGRFGPRDPRLRLLRMALLRRDEVLLDALLRRILGISVPAKRR